MQRIVREELTPILLKLFQKFQRKEPSQTHSITMIPKPDKPTIKKENYTLVSLMSIDAKILNKILANRIQKCIKRIINLIKWDLSQRGKDSSTLANQYDILHQQIEE